MRGKLPTKTQKLLYGQSKAFVRPVENFTRRILAKQKMLRCHMFAHFSGQIFELLRVLCFGRLGVCEQVRRKKSLFMKSKQFWETSRWLLLFLATITDLAVKRSNNERNVGSASILFSHLDGRNPEKQKMSPSRPPL